MATSYLSPGVYVEEVDRGSKPIEAVGTNTVGFLGTCSKGPVNKSIFIGNWTQFVNTFGDFRDSQYLAHAVYGFFNNGGTRCFVTNVGEHPAGADRVGAEEAPAAAKAGEKKEEGKAAPAPKAAKDPKEVQKILTGMFIGEDKGPGARTGLKTFEDVDEISLVVAPGQVDPAIQDAVLTHCELKKNRFAVLDSPETIDMGGIDKIPKPRDSKYGAYYFPWIEVYDPERGNIFVPPSGHMVGIYARSDNERGVHKAPANEIVRGALGLKYNISRSEQDILNPKGINCIRDFSRRGRGIRVWGARTISSDASWRYINVRRLFIMVEESIDIGMQWAVFEPNDHRLWKKITRDVSAFLYRIWRSGALFGQTPEQAFYVKCDAETNPVETIDAGQVITEIGICPVKPAEFVIFRIGQWQSGSDIAE
ncbi:MAG: phage tail sheath family protein [Planctomycetes bacterium]|nr:phage tail sheath family protein [Planctomycetota bacterium]